LFAGESPAGRCEDPHGENPPPVRPVSGRDVAERGSAPNARASDGAETRIDAIAPNPAREFCTVTLAVPRATKAEVMIYDAGGRRVRDLVSGLLGAGVHRARWDRRDDSGRECRDGIYFIVLRADERAWTQRVLLIR